MKRTILVAISVIFIQLFNTQVFASKYLNDSVIKISDSWARKSISPNNNSAAYMKITNVSHEDVIIISAVASEVANNVELHKSFVDEKAISRMVSIDKIVIPANSTIELEPGGIHIMLFDLKKTLNVGDKFKMEIRAEGFEHSAVTHVEVK